MKTCWVCKIQVARLQAAKLQFAHEPCQAMKLVVLCPCATPLSLKFIQDWIYTEACKASYVQPHQALHGGGMLVCLPMLAARLEAWWNVHLAQGVRMQREAFAKCCNRAQ